MGDYERTTRSVRLEVLPAEVRGAVQAHQDEYNLGAIIDDYLDCVETVSEKKKKRLFKGLGDKLVISYAILTPTWLVYATTGDSGHAAVLSVRLAEAKAEDYTQSPFYQRMPDYGYHITGKFTGRVGMHGNERVRVFVALGQGRDAKLFGEALVDAIANTRR
jgi:hypothetical protein